MQFDPLPALRSPEKPAHAGAVERPAHGSIADFLPDLYASEAASAA
jgi:hypothetical protein